MDENWPMEIFGPDPDVIPVRVPDKPNLSNMVLYCKRFKIFFCNGCGFLLTPKETHAHISKCNKGEYRWQNDYAGRATVRFPRESMEAAMTSVIINYEKYAMTEEVFLQTKFHKQIIGLPMHDVYVNEYCLDTNCKQGASASKSLIRKHLKTEHNMDGLSMDEVSKNSRLMKRQFLSGKKSFYILIDPYEETEDGKPHAIEEREDETLEGTNNYDALMNQVPGQYDNETVTAMESVHTRNITLLAAMTSWESYILPEDSEVALWMLRTNHPYLPMDFRQVATERIRVWMQHLRCIVPLLPEYMRCATASQCRERIEFTTVSYENRNYAEVLAMLLQWMLLVCEVVTKEWVEDDGTFRKEIKAYQIPDKWIITDKNIIDKTLNVWHDSGIFYGGPDMVQTNSVLSQTLNDYFLACFARTAEVHMDDEYGYESISIFLVAVCNQLMHKNGGNCVVGTCTNKAAAMEYAMRGSILIAAKSMFKRMKECKNPEYESQEIIMDTSNYIKKWTVPDTESNNVAFILSFFKKQMRRYSTKDSSPTIQFHNSECLDHTVLKPHEARVLFSNLRGGFNQAIAELDQLCSMLMEGFWVDPSVFDLKNRSDDLSNSKNGYSFHLDQKNNCFKDLWKNWRSTQIQTKEWKVQFLASCSAIHDLILFLIHTTSGGPGRTTSMVSGKLINVNGYPRCLQVFEGKLYYMTLYQKGQMINHYEKTSAKRIEPTVAKCVLLYLIIFKPVQDGIISSVGDICNNDVFAARQRHLFCSAKGEMNEDQYGKIIKSHFTKYCKADIGVAGWRHSFSALADEHIRAENPDKPAELHGACTVANDQMGHSNATAADHYGRSSKSSLAGNAYMAEVDTFGEQWQCFILGKMTKDAKPSKKDETAVVERQDNASSGVSTVITHQTTNITYNVNIVANQMDGNVFSKLHGQPQISNWCEKRLRQIYQSIAKRKLHSTPFRHEGTKKCFDTIFSSSLGDYIAVLPTGSGKSLMYQYLAISDLGQMQDIMLVIIPLKELLENQLHISRQLNLPFIRYDVEKPTATMISDMCLDGVVEQTKRVVFVQVEHLGHHFLEFVNYLNACNRLCKMVFDEFHLYMIHQNIRNTAFRNNQNVIQSIGNIGRIFLSATVEMRREQELIDLVSLGVGAGRVAPTVIRHGKIPSNIGFSVTTYDIVDHCLFQLGSNLQKLVASGDAKARYIVFVLTINDMEQVTANLQVNHQLTVTTMHSKMLDNLKKDSRTSWLNGTKPIMVATVSFSHGVDYEDVPYIVLYRGMYDLTTMLQCAGRGGRGEGTKTILEVMVVEEDYKTPASYCQKICNADFCSWVTIEKRCRRNILSHAFYGCTEICTIECLPCDHCLTEDPTLWGKLPGSKSMDFICNGTIAESNVQDNHLNYFDEDLNDIRPEDWYCQDDNQNDGSGNGNGGIASSGNGESGNVGAGLRKNNNANQTNNGVGMQSNINGVVRGGGGGHDDRNGTGSYSSGGHVDDFNSGGRGKRMNTGSRKQMATTKLPLVTQPSPNEFKIYREEEGSDNQGNKRFRSFPVTAYHPVVPLLAVGATRIQIPSLAANDMVTNGNEVFLDQRYSESEQVFFNPQLTYTGDEMYVKDMVPKNACGNCFGRNLKSTLINHGNFPGVAKPKPCPYTSDKRCCFNCSSSEHFSPKCPIKNSRKKLGYCNRCMISIGVHKDGGYGNICCLQTNDFSWNAAWSVYRNNRSVFLECVGTVSNATGILLGDDNLVCQWLMSAATTKPCALNVTRLIVALLKRQQVTTEQHNLDVNG